MSFKSSGSMHGTDWHCTRGQVELGSQGELDSKLTRQLKSCDTLGKLLYFSESQLT